MNKSDKKNIQKQLRHEQRQQALAALPLPISELRALFDMLDEQLSEHACDHSRSLTESWIRQQSHDEEKVLAWLEEQGGYCDCEILGNVEDMVDEAAAGERSSNS